MAQSDWDRGWAQGKAEANAIMTQLAAVDPWTQSIYGSKCVFCGGEAHREPEHGFDCLWMHAQNWAKAQRAAAQ